MSALTKSIVYVTGLLFILYAIFILAQGFMTNFKLIKFNPLAFFRTISEKTGKSIFSQLEQEFNPENVCTFLGNDIYEGRVHKDNKKLTTNVEIDCNACKDYTYKSEDGCSPYDYDMRYSTRGASGTEYLGICTSLSFPRPCDEPDQKSSSNDTVVSSSLP